VSLFTGTATHIQQKRERERERRLLFDHPSVNLIHYTHPPPLVATSIPASIMLDSSHLGHLFFSSSSDGRTVAGRPAAAAAAGVVVSRRSFEFGVIRESRHFFSHFRSSTMAAVGIFLTFSKKILLFLL
jgi:hypothetical protein